MKSRLIPIVCSLIVLLCCAPVQSQAQISVGGGLAYGTDVSTLGIDLRGYYELNVPDALLVIVPNFIWFLPTEEGNADISWWTFDALLHWIFESSEGFEIYTFAGIGITNVGVSIGPFDDSNTEINLNLGLGVEKGTDFGGVFGEFRYVLSDANQLVIEAGARFNLN